MRSLLLVILVASLGAGQCDDRSPAAPSSSRASDSTRTRFVHHDTTLIDSPIPGEDSR